MISFGLTTNELSGFGLLFSYVSREKLSTDDVEGRCSIKLTLSSSAEGNGKGFSIRSLDADIREA